MRHCRPVGLLLFPALAALASLSGPVVGRARAAAPPPGFGALLPSGALLRLGSTRLRDSSVTRIVAFSPDGKLLATVGHSSVIRVWEASTGKLLFSWSREPRDRIEALAFSPDIEALAFSPDGKTLALALGASGVHLQPVNGEGRGAAIGLSKAISAHSVAWSPDGKWLAVGCSDGSVRLWNRSARFFRPDFKDHKYPVRVIAFSPDGKFLASLSPSSGQFDFEDKTVRIWSVERGAVLHVLTARSGFGFRSLTFCEDGKTLATTDWGNNTLQLWDVARGRLRRTVPGRATSVASAGGTRLVLGEYSGTVRVYDLGTDTEVARVSGSRPATGAVALAPDGKTFAAGGLYDQVVGLWRLPSGESVFPDIGHRGPVVDLRFSPDGRTLASRGLEFHGRVCLWDLRTGKEVRRMWLHAGADPPRSDPPIFNSLAFSPDGRTLLTWAGAEVSLWDLPGGTRRRSISPVDPDDHFFAADFSPDGLAVSTVGLDGIRLWSITGRLLSHLDFLPLAESRARGEWDFALAFLPDRRTLVSGFSQNRLRFWSLITGKESRCSQEQSSSWRCALVASAEGNLLAISRQVYTPDHRERSGVVRLLDVPTGACLRELKCPGPCIAFSPDGVLVAGSGGEPDHSIAVYNRFTGQEVGRLEGHPAPVRCLAFSPDGRTLASGSNDTTVLLWNVTKFDTGYRPHRLPSARLDALWSDLGGKDASVLTASWELRQASEQTSPFLDARVRVVAPPVRRVRELLDDLGSDRFATREAAEKTLAGFGEAVEGDLRKALEAGPEADVRRRLQRLLQANETPLIGDALRRLRAVWVLEGIGTAEARAVLKRLAGDPALGRASAEARQALERLARRTGR